MIYTGYFAKIKIYGNAGLRLVSIANCNPATIGDLPITKFAPLAPGSWIYSWKNDLKNRKDLGKAKIEYIDTYYTKHLNRYTPKKLFDDLETFADGHDLCLLCYEAPPKEMTDTGHIDLEWLIAGKSFCHRHLISDFLRQGGFACVEYAIHTKKVKGELF